MHAPNRLLLRPLIAIVLVHMCGSVSAQTDLERTLTVDPMMNATANYQTIQAAIDAIDSAASDEIWTVQVYAGTYDEAINFKAHDAEGNKPYIELVGIDRDAVIIAPESGDAITLYGNNSVRNVTVLPADGQGIVLADDCVVQNTIVQIEMTAGHHIGIIGSAVERVVIENCHVESWYKEGIKIQNLSTDIKVLDSYVLGGDDGGLRFVGTNRAIVQNSHLVGDNSVSEAFLISGLFFDRVSGSTAVKDNAALGCFIELNAPKTPEGEFSLIATGVQTDTDTRPKVVDCYISAASNDRAVYGVNSGGGVLEPNLLIIGSSIRSFCKSERETQVFDARRKIPGVQADAQMRVSRTQASKFLGPILPSVASHQRTQRMLNIAVSDDDAIRTDFDLTNQIEEDVAPTGQPDVYRVLTVTGNDGSMTQDVYIVGADWGNARITDKITLTGTTTAIGKKPFKTVDHMIMPAQTAAGQKVRVGSSDKLGVYFALADEEDLLQQSRLSAGGVYEVDTSSTPVVDVEYATIDPDTITAGDSLEWVIRASN